MKLERIHMDGVLAASVTPFTADGAIDFDALRAYLVWLADVPGVTAIVVNTHAGEGSALTLAERVRIIEETAAAIGDRVPVVASVAGEGDVVVAEEAAAATAAGADGLLVFPANAWLRFGYHPDGPLSRHLSVRAASDLPQILFQYPIATRASYSLATVIELVDKVDTVVGIKEGSRDLIRWDFDIPALRARFPQLAIMTCQDEFLLHSMWESDGALVGYAAAVPEAMVELLAAAKAHDYPLAKARYDALLQLTTAVYNRPLHAETTPALKAVLKVRGIIPDARVRGPLQQLSDDQVSEIRSVVGALGLAAEQASIR